MNLGDKYIEFETSTIIFIEDVKLGSLFTLQKLYGWKLESYFGKTT